MNSLGKAIAGHKDLMRESTTRRQWIDTLFLWVCVGAASLSLVILCTLLITIARQGWSAVNWQFLTSLNSVDAAKAGIYPALMGTAWVCTGCALFSLPIGVATAIFLEEFRPKGRAIRAFRKLVQLNISNLAGVPSVVYGILGLTAFVHMYGIFGTVQEPKFEIGLKRFLQFPTDNPKRFVLVPVGSEPNPKVELVTGMKAYTSSGNEITLNVRDPGSPRVQERELSSVTVKANASASLVTRDTWYHLRLPMGASVLAGSLTLMLVILPIVIISSQEALRAVPDSLREGALGMGCTPWQVVRYVSLPSAMPGIMTGSILAMSRAIGEAAPLLIISGVVFIQYAPDNLFDKFSVMPLQIYSWVSMPDGLGFEALAAGGIIVLLAMLLLFNGLAVLIRHKLQKPLT